ncbi:hypothetical protein [Massilia sp. CCM 8734]|uniref:hypothetical protein n=1 Tax=Massilia sp. CCM 8734 TaxID=2609283 RepID=UPI00141F9D7B|nr:hypothetical protein [Massilia sp. CCM 8734]NHZ95885.1 hypothetical protein [Massilia sp. CCM 8734]
MKLPAQLAPWSAWLALLPAHLAAPLGQMLLRLQPLVGRMAGVAACPDTIPAGAGSIARRGQYQHLLLSEWAVLDAAPDEFIRRAAANELLFSAPEPQVQRRAHICVALFDAGPAQLGEPRLAQLALFILLARRAQDGAADFKWGILQEPHRLHDNSGRDALRSLLAARTLERVGAQHLDDWNWALAGIEDEAEVWQVGAPGADATGRASAHATIGQSLFDSSLEVTITQGRQTRRLQLELPAPQVGAALLRDPFKPPAPPRPRTEIGAGDTVSLLYAPRFAVSGDWIVAARQAGGSVLHAVPNSVYAKTGKPRRYHPTPDATELGVVLFGKMLARVVSNGTHLTFMRFPSMVLGPPRSVPHPPLAHFRAPPGLDRWLPTFFLIDHSPTGVGARVFMIDVDNQLVCWSTGIAHSMHEVRFDPLTDKVVGAIQTDNMLLYARSDGKHTTIHSLAAKAAQAETIGEYEFAVLQVRFGGTQDGWLYAMQLSVGEWRLIDRKATRHTRILVPHGAKVIGVTRAVHQTGHGPALLVLAADRLTLELFSKGDKRVVVRSEAPIAQATLDPSSDRLCWLTGAHELCVKNVYHSGPPLLRVGPAHQAGGA